MAQNQNKIIHANLDPVPVRDKTEKLSLNMWASKNIVLPDDYDSSLTRQAYWDKINDKLEAYRLLSSYRDRLQIFDLTHDKNGDPLPKDQLPKDVATAMGTDYVNNEWVKNTWLNKKQPGIPSVKNPRYCLSSMTVQCGAQASFDDILLLNNVSLGEHKYFLAFDLAWVKEQYPDLNKISRPVVSFNDGKAIFSFTVEEAKWKRPVRGSTVLAADRNADHKNVVVLVRAGANKTLSYPKGPSLQTEATINHKRRLDTDISRVKRKTTHIKNELEQNGHLTSKRRESLENKLSYIELDLSRKLSKRQDVEKGLDRSQMEDMRRHLAPGEAPALERLKMFGGNSMFRHGQTTASIEHKMERDGGQVVFVNLAYTTSRCMCGEDLKINDKTHTAYCPACDETMGRHSHVAEKIGVRGLRAIGYDVKEEDFVTKTHSMKDLEDRSRRKQVKRERKMASRKTRGKKTYRIKSGPTPSRPPVHKTPASSGKWVTALGKRKAGAVNRTGSLQSVTTRVDWSIANQRLAVTGLSVTRRHYHQYAENQPTQGLASITNYTNKYNKYRDNG